MRRNVPSRSAVNLLRDDGPEHASKLIAAVSALLPVGAECRVFSPNASSHGARVFVVKGYGLHRVEDDKGEYISDRGLFDYRPGYIVREGNSPDRFSMAGQLVPIKSKDDIGHLRLVKVKGRKR